MVANNVVIVGAAGRTGANPKSFQNVKGYVRGFDVRTGNRLWIFHTIPETKWQIAHGETPDAVKNHPLLKGLNIPRTGQGGMTATLVTKTLLISGEPRVGMTSTGVRGAMLRAYDKATGKDAGAVYMPAPESGAPMTYLFNGKQYIVLAVSGGAYSGELLAFKLPD